MWWYLDGVFALTWLSVEVWWVSGFLWDYRSTSFSGVGCASESQRLRKPSTHILGLRLSQLQLYAYEMSWNSYAETCAQIDIFDFSRLMIRNECFFKQKYVVFSFSWNMWKVAPHDSFRVQLRETKQRWSYHVLFSEPKRVCNETVLVSFLVVFIWIYLSKCQPSMYSQWISNTKSTLGLKHKAKVLT